MNRSLDGPLSPWVLLLDGLSKTAIGAGLLLGQVATLVERRTTAAVLAPVNGRAAVTVLRPAAALDKAVA